MYVIVFPDGLAVGKHKTRKRFTETVSLDDAYVFSTRIAAKLVNSHRKGTIKPV